MLDWIRYRSRLPRLQREKRRLDRRLSKALDEALHAERDELYHELMKKTVAIDNKIIQLQSDYFISKAENILFQFPKWVTQVGNYHHWIFI
jgi:hypothetical protein